MGALRFRPLQPQKKQRTQNAGWVFIIAAQFSPRAKDEAIVGMAAGSMVQSDTDHHGLTLQFAETSGFAFHQLVKWAMTQVHPVTIFFDCAGAGFLAAGFANPSVETKAIVRQRGFSFVTQRLMVSLSSSRTLTAMRCMA